ncbi:MAG TPA: UDP-N-acetylglucosamine 2-epimerase (non-hydrolyzing) [Candidatus Acidoferrales bacterium]|nr:UDP-N-acetylglucosamine 2-epimerase (non-hydrolyzing) [Candidatus Acidoferrales bacterium]
MRTITVVGARPQFVKAAVLAPVLARAGIADSIVHTGQHYDRNMSDVFFDELEIPEPAYTLGVGSAPQGEQTGEMMCRIEPVLMREQPDCIIVYGDTNTTLAAALVAAKMGIPIAHVEAGCRSFDRSMPEEVNRVLTDHLSTFLFAPTEVAAANVYAEGIRNGIHVVGDVTIDLAQATSERLPAAPDILNRLQVRRGTYAFVTIHRAGTANDVLAFERIVGALRLLGMPVIFAAHPRVRPMLDAMGAGVPGDPITVTDPLSYIETIAAVKNARVVITDSGGLQKEAAVLAVPCVTVRTSTEWVETVRSGWNVLAGTDPQAIVSLAHRARPDTPLPYTSDGRTAERIVSVLLESRAAMQEIA